MTTLTVDRITTLKRRTTADSTEHLNKESTTERSLFLLSEARIGIDSDFWLPIFIISGCASVVKGQTANNFKKDFQRRGLTSDLYSL